VTAAQKLEWIRATVTAGEALALIGGFFTKDPGTRINAENLAHLASELAKAVPSRSKTLRRLCSFCKGSGVVHGEPCGSCAGRGKHP
jgi:hypothetical protein